MIPKISTISILLLFTIVFSNCTISKRHYRKGYHLAWHTISQQKTKQEKNLKSESKLTRQEHLNQQVNVVIETARIELTASANKMGLPRVSKFIAKQIKTGNDSCADVLVFRDGTELTVKVVEIFNGTIKYLPCNNLDGPLRVANGDKIFMVKYANGTKEVFKETVRTQTPDARKVEPIKQKMNVLALISFISSILGFIPIFGIAAVILGAISLNQISRAPQKYKNRWMAIFGLVAGGIWTFLNLIAYFSI